MQVRKLGHRMSKSKSAAIMGFIKKLLPKQISSRWTERQLHREYRDKLAEAEKKGDRQTIDEIEHYYSDMAVWLYLDSRLIGQKRIIKKARRLGLPVLERTSDESDETWEKFWDEWLLTDEAFTDLRREIRREQKENLELWRTRITLLIGLFGSMASVLSVWLARSSK